MGKPLDVSTVPEGRSDGGEQTEDEAIEQVTTTDSTVAINAPEAAAALPVDDFAAEITEGGDAETRSQA